MGKDATGKRPETQATHDAIRTVEALMQATFPEPVWAIPGLVPAGLAVMAGKPKIGKSWLALDMCLAVAGGGTLLGHTRVPQGGALYLALEDTERRLQERTGKLLAGMPPEQQAAARAHMAYVCSWPILTEGGTAALDGYLAAHPDTRLVVLDTLARVAPQRRANADRYQYDYALICGLKAVADRHRTALVLVTHTTKLETEGDVFDEIAGSVGITGAADTGLVLRHDERRQVQLVVRGRDVERNELTVCFDPDTCRWGLAAHDTYGALTAELRQVAVLLERADELMPKDVAAALRISDDAAQGRLKKLVERGVAVKGEARGKYALSADYRDVPPLPHPHPHARPSAAAGADDDDDEADADPLAA